MATADKDLRRLMDEIAKWPGWRVTDTRKGFRIFPPDGQTPISCPHGPRNPWRTRANVIAKLRRAGADI